MTSRAAAARSPTLNAATVDGPRRRTAVVIVAVVVLAGYVFHSWQFVEQINDDAFITFRYSKFLSLGRGPYFNIGEHVEGYTNFLLMLILAGVHWLGGDGALLPTAKFIGIASGCVALWGAARLAAGYVGSGAVSGARAGEIKSHAAELGWLAAGLAAVSSAYAVNSTTGLETTLFGALIVCGLRAVLTADECGRWRGAGVLFGLACLTRPEGTLIFAAVAAGQIPALVEAWRRTRVGDEAGGVRTAFVAHVRRWAVDGALVAVAVGGVLVFRHVAYDGELVPNTYFAKQGGVVNLTAWGYITEYVRHHLAIVPWLLALLPVAIGEGESKRRALPSTLVMFASIGAIFAAGADWMLGSRLFVPYAPVVAALAGAGVALLVARMLGAAGGARDVPADAEPRDAWEPKNSASCGRESLADAIEVGKRAPRRTVNEPPEAELANGMRTLTRRSATAAAAGTCIVALIGVIFLWEGRIRGVYHEWVATRAIGYRDGHGALADWLNQEVRPGGTVALMDIGIVGFRCIDLHVLDVSGLTDRTIAKSPGPFLNKDYDTSYVFGRKPEIIVVVLQFRIDERGVPEVENPIPWTRMEKKLMEAPEFHLRYARPRPDPRSGSNLDRLAAVLGAERVFEHRVPTGNYMLCAYRNGEQVGSAGSCPNRLRLAVASDGRSPPGR